MGLNEEVVGQRIGFTDANSLAKIKHAAISVEYHPQTDSYHSGVIYRQNPNSAPRLLHLAWHFDLRNESSICPQSIWSSPNIPEPRLKQVAASCRLIWKKHEKQGLPYAFSSPKAFFDLSGDFISRPNRIGLTCSSFVLAVFHHARIHLLDYGTWQHRDEDLKRKDDLLDYLSKTKSVDSNHIDAVNKQVHLFRYSPIDVITSAALFPPKATFNDILRYGPLASAKAQNIK